MTRAPRFLDHFASETGGSVAIMFAAALVPLVIGIGSVLDYSRASQARAGLPVAGVGWVVDDARASRARADLQSAVDAAALVVGRVAVETGSRDNAERARA